MLDWFIGDMPDERYPLECRYFLAVVSLLLTAAAIGDDNDDDGFCFSRENKRKVFTIWLYTR